MRVLVTSTPGAGHLHPIVPIARALADAGHELLWATASGSCARVERYGFTAAPAGMSARERGEQLLATTPGFAELPLRARRVAAFSGHFARAAAPRMHDDLVGVFETFEPDVVVHDLAELAAPPMATARGIPHVTIAFSGAIPGPVVERAVEEIAGIWSAEGQVVPDDLGLADHLYVHPFPPVLGAPPRGRHVRAVRPLHFDGGNGDPCPDWVGNLGAERPAIYVTFGTEHGTRAPWRIVLDAVGSLDVDVVATTGSGLDRDELPPVPDSVRVEAYVPQHVLLDRVTAVVSHAGAGTMLAAIGHGLPQACLPLAADQFANADALSGAGAALTLEPAARDAEAVSEAVARLLEEAAFGDAARSVAAQIANLPHPATLVPTIEALVTPR